jgi:hypothetical protein
VIDDVTSLTEKPFEGLASVEIQSSSSSLRFGGDVSALTTDLRDAIQWARMGASGGT